MADLHIQKITSLDLPELAPYRTMRRPLEHETAGHLRGRGRKGRAPAARKPFCSRLRLLPEKIWMNFRPLLEARPENLTVYLADKKMLEKLIGFSMYQGELAVGKIPPPVTLDDILSKKPETPAPRGRRRADNAENLGALVRNCVAFGVQALIVGETSSSPFLRRAVRNSMGTILQLPVVELAKLGQRHRFTDQTAHHRPERWPSV